MTKRGLFQNETNQTFQDCESHIKCFNKREKFSTLISLSWEIVGYQRDPWGKLQYNYPWSQLTASKIDF